MPKAFKDSYPTTHCIIDATEIFIQTPSNPQAQQLIYSSYKNQNTLKALVVVTPSGAISFVSNTIYVIWREYLRSRTDTTVRPAGPSRTR